MPGRMDPGQPHQINGIVIATIHRMVFAKLRIMYAWRLLNTSVTALTVQMPARCVRKIPKGPRETARI